jgi:hypothetical protein
MPTNCSPQKERYWEKSKPEELANPEKVLLPVFLLSPWTALNVYPMSVRVLVYLDAIEDSIFV